jgi:DNA transformation protein
MGDDAYIDFLRELLAPLGPFRARRMFGGWGVYVDDCMIGLVADGELYLKVDAVIEDRFAAAGSEPFVYDGKGTPIRMSYWRAPDEALDGADAMRPWASLALAAARRAVAAKALAATKRRRTSADVAPRAPARPRRQR